MRDHTLQRHRDVAPKHNPLGVIIPSNSCKGVKLIEDTGSAVSHGTERRLTSTSKADGMP